MHFEVESADCQMPVMDGYEATRILRTEEQFKQLPILAMTASATKEEQQQCKDVGMNDFIAKPINIETVKHTLAKWH